MKQLILTQFPWPWLPVAALIIFFVFFVGMILFTGLKTRKTIFTSASQLPLEDGIALGSQEGPRKGEAS